MFAMEENNKIAISKKNELLKLGKTFKATYKIIFKGADQLFNEAFYLINSRDLKRNGENYCFQLEYDRKFLKKNKFNFLAESDDDYLKAIILFTEAIKIKPNFKLAFHFRGIANRELGKYDEAIADFTKAIEIDSGYSSAYYNMGIIKVFRADYEDSIGYVFGDRNYIKEGEKKCLNFFLRDSYENFSCIESFSKDFHGALDLFEAIDDLSKAIKIEPNYADAYLLRGFIYWKINQELGAIADLAKAIELEQDKLQAYIIRGEILGLYRIRGYKEEAIIDYNKAIEIHSKVSYIWLRRGVLKWKINNIEGAIADFSKVVEIDPNNAFAYHYRGEAKLEIKDYDGAMADCNKAIKVMTDCTDYTEEMKYDVKCFYFTRGNVKRELKDYAGAFADFSKAIEGGNDLSNFHGYVWLEDIFLSMGDVRLELNDYRGAITDYSKAIKIKPKGEYFFKRSLAYEAIGMRLMAKLDSIKAKSLCGG